MLIFAVLIAAILVLAAWCLLRIRREYRQGRELSPATVTGVWALYLFHLGVTIGAAYVAPWALPLNPALSTAVGAVLIGVGAVMCAAGVVSFHSFQRMSGMDTSRLVTGGIYAWSRNPQNVGWALALLGIAVWGRSGLALLLTVLFWAIFRIYVPVEEAFLESVFGDEYRAYRARSHRYFGPPRRSGESLT